VAILIHALEDIRPRQRNGQKANSDDDNFSQNIHDVPP
jgi:hypothetical protein